MQKVEVSFINKEKDLQVTHGALNLNNISHMKLNNAQ